MDLQMAYQDAQGNQIPLPPDVWEATHPAARQFILLLLEQNRALREEVRVLREQVQKLTEQVNLNSRNSSKPPSSDPPWVPGKPKSPTGRGRGGQRGHQGHRRQLLPEERVTRVEDYFPEQCRHCGLSLPRPMKPGIPPFRHQVIAIGKPPALPGDPQSLTVPGL